MTIDLCWQDLSIIIPCSWKVLPLCIIARDYAKKKSSRRGGSCCMAPSSYSKRGRWAEIKMELLTTIQVMEGRGEGRWICGKESKEDAESSSASGTCLMGIFAMYFMWCVGPMLKSFYLTQTRFQWSALSRSWKLQMETILLLKPK